MLAERRNNSISFSIVALPGMLSVYSLDFLTYSLPIVALPVLNIAPHLCLPPIVLELLPTSYSFSLLVYSRS